MDPNALPAGCAPLILLVTRTLITLSYGRRWTIRADGYAWVPKGRRRSNATEVFQGMIEYAR